MLLLDLFCTLHFFPTPHINTAVEISVGSFFPVTSSLGSCPLGHYALNGLKFAAIFRKVCLITSVFYIIPEVLNRILWLFFCILVTLQIFGLLADSVMKDEFRNMDADSQITEVHDGTVPIKHRRNWSLGSHLQFHSGKFALSRTSSKKSSSTSLVSMDVQESNEHPPHVPLMKKLIGFGSNHNLKELSFHHYDSSEESHHHHHHGTSYKNVFGYENAATESAQRRFDLFGYNDAKDVDDYEKSSHLFGTEDLEFETGQKGRDLFGNDDVASEDTHLTREIFGFEDADSESSQEARHVFGDDGEGEEVSEAEVEEDDAEENVPVALPVDHLKIA